MVLLYKNVGHASRSITVTTAMVLLSRTDDESVKNVVVTSTFFCREYGFEDERQLLAKLKYRRVQRKKQVYSIIIP